MILALQYCHADRERAMALARLLADLEPCFRGDVFLALVKCSDTPPSRLDDETEHYCSRKMRTATISLPGGCVGWPEGPNILWTNTMDYFAHHRGWHSSIFTFDGGDAVPLHNNWLDLLIAEHAKTVTDGKLVTGWPGLDSSRRLHVSGSMVLELDIWDCLPVLHTTPADDGWDCYHSKTLEPHTSLSTFLRNDWRKKNPTFEMFEEYAKTSIWWHGYKEPAFQTMAGDYLIVGLDRKPTVPILKRWRDFAEFESQIRIKQLEHIALGNTWATTEE